MVFTIFGLLLRAAGHPPREAGVSGRGIFALFDFPSLASQSAGALALIKQDEEGKEQMELQLE